MLSCFLVLMFSNPVKHCDHFAWGREFLNLMHSFEPRQANLCLRAFRHDKF